MKGKHDDTLAEVLLYQTDDGTTRVEVRMSKPVVRSPLCFLRYKA